jgi:hypothetical protein
VNSGIIAVSPTGEISAISAGTTQAEASAGAVSVKLDVVVTAPAAARVVVTPSSDSVRVGQSSALNVRVLDSRSAPVDAPVTWRSTNVAIASVTSRGLVQGHRAGDAYIVATLGALADSARIAVFSPAEITRVTPDPVPPPAKTTPRVADVDPLATSLAQSVTEALSRGRVAPVTASADFERFVKDNAPIRADGAPRITRGTLTDNNRVDVTIVLPVKWRDFSGRTKSGTVELVATYEARNGAWQQGTVRNSSTPR